MTKKTLSLLGLMTLLFSLQVSLAYANPTSVTIAGDLQSELGCSDDWQPDCADTQLTLEAGDDVWQAEFTLPAGNYQYKAALDGDWAENYGANAQPDGDNISLNLAAETTVKFYYDHKTHWVTDNQNAIIATAAGDFQSELGCSGDWLPDCLLSWLQDPDGDGVYIFKTTALPAGDYQVKVPINESWDENYGANGDLNGDNIPFTVPGDNQEMTFTFSGDSKVMSVTAPEPPDPSLNADLVEPSLRSPLADDVMYFVMPDRFDNGKPANDRGGLTGNRTVTGLDPTHKGFYHGGDLAGLLNRLEYLDNLGITAIWLTPTFKNIPYDARRGDAGYHGYWVTDFEQFDPHLGTNAELETLIEEAHARGMKIFFDIIVNHTADVIQYEENEYGYISKKDVPYKDENGDPFDDRDFAGTNDFPALDAATSFPYTPSLPAGQETIKKPAWLNNPIYYHNRGDSSFIDENSLYGDFDRLDDLFTEHPDVVNGMIDVFKFWVENYDIDGFRVDTVKHVNIEFWQQFVPAILDHAAANGKPDFYIFGEVFAGDGRLLSYYPTVGKMPAVLDFGFQGVTRAYVSQRGNSANLKGFFDGGDLYTDADSNAYFLPTFVGNHDMGRFGLFLNQDNVPNNEKLARYKLGHAFMMFARGTPVIYYGAEQGFTGDGNDQAAREDMMPSQVTSYNDNDLVGTNATTADSNFDPDHPLYRAFREYANIYQNHRALRRGAQIERFSSDGSGVYVFSRIDRQQKIEYIVAFNNVASNGVNQAAEVTVDTFYPGGVAFERVFDTVNGLAPILLYLPIIYNDDTTDSETLVTNGATQADNLETNAAGQITIDAPPLGFAIYRATTQIPTSNEAPNISIAQPLAGQTVDVEVNSIDGNEVLDRIEVRANLDQNIFAEVTFAVKIDDGDYQAIGTDDNPPYRVFYDITHLRDQNAALSFGAIVDDLHGNVNAAEVKNIGYNIIEPAPLDASIQYGIVHYQRDGDDYTGWGVEAGGDGVDGDQLYAGDQPVIGETDYGRFAFIKLTDPAQTVDFTIRQNGTTDDVSGSFTPNDVDGEVWMKEGDTTVYSSQAEAQDFTTIRYQRGDDNYTGVTLDISGGASGIAPTGTDDNGAFFNVTLGDYSQPLQFTIKKNGTPDITDASYTPTEIATAWLNSGDATVFASQGAAEGFATIHYHRPDGDYGDPNTANDFTEFWGLHTFGGAADPGWETPREPAGTDAFGIYFEVAHDPGATGFGYIIHKGNLKDPNYAGEEDGPNMRIDMAKYGHAVWHIPVTYPSRSAFNPDNPPPVVYPVVGEAP